VAPSCEDIITYSGGRRKNRPISAAEKINEAKTLAQEVTAARSILPPASALGPLKGVVKHMMVCISLIAGLAADVAHAQFGVPWRHTPSITAVSLAGNPRLQAVDEAVSFWNRMLEEIGSGFRLGPITRTDQPVPEERCSRSAPLRSAGAGHATLRRPSVICRGTSRFSSPGRSSCRSPAPSTQIRSGSWGFAGQVFRP
jgi:hypothetical protein